MTLTAMGLALPISQANAQYAVCNETCPSPLTNPAGAAACAARIATCNHNLTLYAGYMTQLGALVTTYQLPQLYRDVLQQFYPGVNLASYRFGFSNRQPPSNATTDCSVTYWNNAAAVDAVRFGTVSTDTMWRWLFHELRHFGQCMAIGGRWAYAKMWFGQLETTFIQNADLATLHDRMPMEGNADNVAAAVLTGTEPFRDVNNRLVRPIAVTLANGSGQTLGASYSTTLRTTQQLHARVTGGSDPLRHTWRWRPPGNTNWLIPPTMNITDGGSGFRFVPTSTGTYVVRVTVSQPGSNLREASRDVTINVITVRLSQP